MAAGKDAMVEGEHLGINANQRVMYEATGEDAKLAYDNLADIVVASRSASVEGFQQLRANLNLTANFARKKAGKAKKV